MPPHNYASCKVCSRNSQGCQTVVTDLQDQMDQGYIVAYQGRDYNQVNMVNSDNKVNVIVPQFNDSEPRQITYDSRKASVTPLIAEGSKSFRSIKETFHCGGFINATFPEVSAITEVDDSVWEPYCDDPEYDLEAEDAYVPFYFPQHKELEYIPGSDDEQLKPMPLWKTILKMF
ncbi:hypothetical protein KIW84_071415 [Lathyrus oleraceus]|uniref:Uncharacterized protein n=1 Tax=Pisum sativum TaxID=3888 RepID=A0A9D4VKG9_PEA|nr:hypothetical protein KIW84_071415 [Pisum sativum]